MRNSLCIFLTLFSFAFTVNPEFNEINWNEEYKLTWGDFMGTPKPYSDFVAQTVSVIEQSYTCNNGNFDFDIKAKFNRERSWTKTYRNFEVLLHEQKHFDLTEIYARKMRQAYLSIDNPCKYSMDELGNIYDEYFEELKNVQDQYDAETDHGLNKQRQRAWNDMIAKRLASLDGYK